MIDAIAGIAAAHAQLAGVGFRIDRPEVAGSIGVTVGPIV
jgi:hypothetical protein